MASFRPFMPNWVGAALGAVLIAGCATQSMAFTGTATPLASAAGVGVGIVPAQAEPTRGNVHVISDANSLLPAPPQPRQSAYVSPHPPPSTIPNTIPQHLASSFIDQKNLNMTVARQLYFDQLKLSYVAQKSKEVRDKIQRGEFRLYHAVRVRYVLGYRACGPGCIIMRTWSMVHPVPSVIDDVGHILNKDTAYPLSSPWGENNSGVGQGTDDTSWLQSMSANGVPRDWISQLHHEERWNRRWLSEIPLNEIPPDWIVKFQNNDKGS